MLPKEPMNVNFGFTFVMGMAVFVLGGYWLDQQKGSGSFWTIVGVVLAFAYGIYEVYKLLRRNQHNTKDK